MTAAGLVVTVGMGAGIVYFSEDYDLRRDHEGMPIEQPHDHHGRAPFQATTLGAISASGSSTATAVTFSPMLFEDWKNGQFPWPVLERPNLFIKVSSTACGDLADCDESKSDEGDVKT
jgi:hypothetical protein